MSSSNPTIIYFGNDWFAENRTSSHHVARQLAKTHPVLYVECPGLRAPQSSRRDIKKLFVKLWRFVRGASTVGENVTVLTLPQLPFHRYRIIRALNRVLSRLTLRMIMFRKGIRRPISWFTVPHVGHLCGTLGEQAAVYYCVDDYAAHPDMDVEAVQQMDDALTRQATLVFVTSETLLAAKRALNPRTFPSPHGVDVEHFALASDGGPVPDDVDSLPKPIVGFFGLIASWIDLDLIEYLARARPQYTFVMIGRTAVPEQSLPRLPNLHFLGRRPYESLPAYGRGFDCCVIPYRLTRQVLHANPLKLREYLAMGKPIVAVSTPEIDQFQDVVAIARNSQEFLEKLDGALATKPTAAEVAFRRARVAGMSWEARTAAVWQTVAEELELQDQSGRPPRAEAQPLSVSMTP